MEFLYHLLFMGIFFVPLILFAFKAVQGRKMPLVKRSYPGSAFLQMTLQYVIAYNVVFFIQELFLAWGKNWIGLTSYLYHNNHGWEGTDPRTSLLQGSGALAIFLFGLLMAGLFLLIKKKAIQPWTKVMFLWLALQGLMQSLPQVTTAFVAQNTDTGQAFAYLEINGIVGFVIALASVIAIVFASKWAFDQFAELGVFESTNSRSQWISMTTIIALPALVASFLIIPYRVLPWDRGFNQFFGLIPWLPWFFVFSASKVRNMLSMPLEAKGLLATGIIAIVILLIFQLILAPGLVFEV